jgi:hypothetical protein
VLWFVWSADLQEALSSSHAHKLSTSSLHDKTEYLLVANRFIECFDRLRFHVRQSASASFCLSANMCYVFVMCVVMGCDGCGVVLIAAGKRPVRVGRSF